MTTVNGTLKNAANVAQQGVPVVVTLEPEDSPGFVPSADYEVTEKATTTTDSSGNWTLSLVGNSLIAYPTDTYYKVKTGKRVSYITVPASGGPYRVEDILVTPSSSGPTRIDFITDEIGEANIITSTPATRTLGRWKSEMAKRQLLDLVHPQAIFMGDSHYDGGQGYIGSIANYHDSIVDQIRRWIQLQYGDGGLGCVPLTKRGWTVAGTWTVFNPLTAADRQLYGDAYYGASHASQAFTAKCDRFNLYYIDTGTSADGTYKVDAGSEVALGCATAHDNALKKVSVTGLSDASHTITIYAPNSASRLYIAYVEFLRGTTGAVVHDLSRGTTGTRNIFAPGLAVPDSRLSILDFIPADLVFFENMAIDLYSLFTLGITTGPEHQANVEAVIDRCRSVAAAATPVRNPDFVVQAHCDLDKAVGYTLGMTDAFDQRAIEQYHYNAAVTRGAAFLNIAAAWGSYDDNLSRMYDGLHPSQVGYDDVTARMIHLLDKG